MFSLPTQDALTAPQGRYCKVQETCQKDAECLFGMMQSRLRVLRWEKELCNAVDVVIVSGVCVIPHSLLIRMEEAGEFSEAADGEYRQCNVKTQLMIRHNSRL